MKTLSFLLIVIFLSTPSFAAPVTIKLKSGETVDGEVLKLTDDQVVLDRGKSGISIYGLNEIDPGSSDALKAMPKLIKDMKVPSAVFTKTPDPLAKLTPEQKKTRQEEYDMAMAHGNDGEWQALVEGMTKVIAIAPTAGTLLGRAEGYMNLEEDDLALADLNKSIDLFPTGAALLRRGRIFTLKHKFDLALADFEQATTLDPKNPQIYYWRGWLYSDYKNNELALKDFSKAIEMDPNYGEAYEKRAFLYYMANDFDRAWKDINTAEAAGYQVNADLLQALKGASGRKY